MAKAIFEFDTIDDAHEISMCANLREISLILDNINNYARNLDKYEERENIPTEEIVDKLRNYLDRWYYIDKME